MGLLNMKSHNVWSYKTESVEFPEIFMCREVSSNGTLSMGFGETEKEARLNKLHLDNFMRLPVQVRICTLACFRKLIEGGKLYEVKELIVTDPQKLESNVTVFRVNYTRCSKGVLGSSADIAAACLVHS